MTTTTLSLLTRLRPSEDTLYRNLDGEAVLLGLKSAGYYGLDPVGTRIFELIAEKNVLRDVLDCVLAEFDVDDERAHEDLIELCAHLIEKGLVDVVDEQSAVTP
jgi:hypothetical protein